MIRAILTVSGAEPSEVEEVSNLSDIPPNAPLSDILPIAPFSEVSSQKSVPYPYQQLPYADLLPSPSTIGEWATSRPMDHFACDLMKVVFTEEERISCNVNGKMGKQQFDNEKIHLIQKVLLHFSGITPNSVEWAEVWKNCVLKIDARNRSLRR